MLNSFAHRLSSSPARRQLLFAGATLFTIFFVGYHFGTFDQAVHIPFLKKYADPTLYPGDRFLDLRLQHNSYFWFFFLPFYRLGILDRSVSAACPLTAKTLQAIERANTGMKATTGD